MFFAGRVYKKLTRLAAIGMRNILPSFKAIIMIYQSNVNSDDEYLLGKITHL